MRINEEQLKKWSVAPGTSRAKATYGAIKNALENSELLLGKKVDIYLQGSYANSTNIKSDSDVDVVVQLNSVWNSDLSRLSPQEEIAYKAAVTSSDYGVAELRNDVFKSLGKYFGQQVVDDSGNKSIKVLGNNGRLNADVVPALQHRIYTSFASLEVPTFVEGMKFKSKDRIIIENFPKLHKEKGEEKNSISQAGEHYKHLVRVMKNIKRQLVDSGVIPGELAPSYFVECLIHNVPNSYFGENYQNSLGLVLRFLQTECDVGALRAGNGIHLIFGDKPWQWNSEENAARFLENVNNFLGIRYSP